MMYSENSAPGLQEVREEVRITIKGTNRLKNSQFKKDIVILLLHLNHRTKTVRDALRRRKSVYTARKNTIRYQSQRDKIDEEPDQLEVMPPKSAVSLKLSPLPYRIAEQDNKSETDGTEKSI